MAHDPTKDATITYADAGVDIDRANRTKKRIKYLAHKTFTRGVLSEIGGFGGLFAVDKAKYLDPVLVSSVDGVGTKLKVAFEMNVHHTIGADLVNHCVNDIAVQGATPLFFMDYLATGKLDPEVAERVVEGLAEACKHNGCALIGGETAEMPGFYPEGEYDLAGFIVGVVERDRIITGKAVEIGDVVLGLASNGLHTNGYSLARKLLFEVAHYTPESYVNELKGKVGNELMRTHKSYWPAIKRLVDGECVSAMAHITGGGITENLPRVLPRGTAAVMSWPLKPVIALSKLLPVTAPSVRVSACRTPGSVKSKVAPASTALAKPSVPPSSVKLAAPVSVPVTSRSAPLLMVIASPLGTVLALVIVQCALASIVMLSKFVKSVLRPLSVPIPDAEASSSVALPPPMTAPLNTAPGTSTSTSFGVWNHTAKPFAPVPLIVPALTTVRPIPAGPSAITP